LSYPEGLRKLLKYLNEKYCVQRNLPLFITENGTDMPDEKIPDEKVTKFLLQHFIDCFF